MLSVVHVDTLLGMGFNVVCGSVPAMYPSTFHLPCIERILYNHVMIPTEWRDPVRRLAYLSPRSYKIMCHPNARPLHACDFGGAIIRKRAADCTVHAIMHSVSETYVIDLWPPLLYLLVFRGLLQGQTNVDYHNPSDCYKEFLQGDTCIPASQANKSCQLPEAKFAAGGAQVGTGYNFKLCFSQS